MGVASGPGWGGGPGWALASVPSGMGNNDVYFTDATSVAGTAVAQTPSTMTTAPASTTATFNSLSTSPASANPTSTDSSSNSTSIAVIAGPVLGGVAGAGLIAFLLYWCCKGKRNDSRRSRFEVKRSKSEEKVDKRRLRDAEEIAAAREQTLRDLENRRRERERQQQSVVGGFDFGILGYDRGHANSIEPVPNHTASPRSPRWI